LTPAARRGVQPLCDEPQHIVFTHSKAGSGKDIDMASIEKYIKYLERPNTRKFSDVIIKGMKYALNLSIDKMAKSMAGVYKKYD